MNVLVLGDPKPLLDHLPDRFLLIDDGPLIDGLRFPSHHSVTRFDPTFHRVNPLKDKTHARVREIASVLYAADPGGDGTLTVRNGRRALAKLLMDADRLTELSGNPKDPAIAEALGLVDSILFSPIIKDIVSDGTNVSFSGTILARLDRAELGDLDAYVIGNLLASLYPGPVVIPDFGFYQSPFHVKLLRQNRLLAGVRALAQVPHFAHHLLSAPIKEASGCLPDDAAVLAQYRGLVPGTVEHTDFIHASVQSPPTVPESEG